MDSKNRIKHGFSENFAKLLSHKDDRLKVQISKENRYLDGILYSHYSLTRLPIDTIKSSPVCTTPQHGFSLHYLQCNAMRTSCSKVLFIAHRLLGKPQFQYQTSRIPTHPFSSDTTMSTKLPISSLWPLTNLSHPNPPILITRQHRATNSIPRHRNLAAVGRLVSLWAQIQIYCLSVRK